MTDIELYLQELAVRAAAGRVVESAPATTEGVGPGEAVVLDTDGGETLYVVYDEDDVKLLIASEPEEIHRGMVWTKAEVKALARVEDDAEVLAEIRRLKQIIPGKLSVE